MCGKMLLALVVALNYYGVDVSYSQDVAAIELESMVARTFRLPSDVQHTLWIPDNFQY